MVKIIPYYRVFRRVKKKVNFVFYLTGPTECIYVGNTVSTNAGQM